ncbi:ABC transporter permease [Desulfothermus sp.]
MKIQIKKVYTQSKARSVLLAVVAVLLALSVSSLLLATLGKSPLSGIVIFLKSGFGSTYAFFDSLNKAIPLFLCAIALSISFKMQIWNIGGEGQYALGAIGATFVYLYFPNLPWYFLIPLMFTSSAILGGLFGVIPAILKVYFDANEIITTLMLNYVGILLIDYLVYGPWQDPTSLGFPMSVQFGENGTISTISNTPLYKTIYICIILGVLYKIFFQTTKIGYEIKVSGENENVARYSHIPRKKLIIFVLFLSGAICGIAGFTETVSTVGRLQPSVIAGYGYKAIIVAWLARLSTIGMGIFSYFLGAMLVGVEGLQLEMQVPEAYGMIIQGMILIFVVSFQFFEKYKISIKKE